MTSRTFELEFSSRVRPAATIVGVTPRNAAVEVTDEELRIWFGLWRLVTSRANVAGCDITGPYRWWKVAGPPHLSLADRGITFATTTDRGVCIHFVDPVRMRPSYGGIHHPAATVTVQDVHGLASLLEVRSPLAALAT